MAMETGYDAPRIAHRLAHLLAGLLAQVLGRLHSDRVMRKPVPVPWISPPQGGHPPKHGGESVFGEPDTGGNPAGRGVPQRLGARQTDAMLISARRGRPLLRFWTTTRANFYADDQTARWTARAAWLLVTASVWLVLMFTVVWGAMVAGAPSGTVLVLTVGLAFTVPIVSMVAVTSGPRSRIGAPALTALILTGAVILGFWLS
ncbi:hypothetical protein ACFC1R_37300 [Kitasatospora sp. NPDC056138]|uniref:hypothetical protein n=1 Tax=Kitasatospora sp. NPDC056138 TaxID=3345724 RepID=UPI0035D7E394